jgi:AcrR family transcriptional regulator
VPRISASTVVEHHALQRRALLDATRALLAETGEMPSMGTVARRAGLARTSLYQYFGSADELLAAVVGDVFPEWADRVLQHVASATEPGEQVWKYIEINLELFAGSEQSVAQALTRVVEPRVLQGPMEAFHAQLQIPLRGALVAFGEPEPDAVAEHIDALIVQASRELETADPTHRRTAKERTLARLRRLLGGYLRLADGPRGSPTTGARPSSRYHRR